MPVGSMIALTMFAQAASSAAPAPSLPPTPAPQPVAAKAPERDCTAQATGPNANEIVICAPRPLGYRISPDLLQAWRDKKRGNAGAPKNPHENYADHSCATVGPMGCRGTPTINLISAAMFAAQMGSRLAKGEEIGSLFVTEPQGGSEFQLYQAAKQRREDKEAIDAAKAKIAAEIAAKAAAKPAVGSAAASGVAAEKLEANPETTAPATPPSGGELPPG